RGTVQGDRIIGNRRRRNWRCLSRAPTERALEWGGTIPSCSATCADLLCEPLRRAAHVPPLAQLAAQSARVERKHEHAVELDAGAAAGRREARGPACDA